MDWYCVPGHENYSVNEEGKVAVGDVYGTIKLLKQFTRPDGYLSVKLNRKGYLVHRLVADAFVEGRSKRRTIVNHKDGDKGNNHYKNLEWCTPSENSRHAHSSGLINYTSSQRKITIDGIEYESITKAAQATGIDRQKLYSVVRGRRTDLTQDIRASTNPDRPDIMPDGVWKEIEGYHGYMVSNDGRVYSCRRKCVMKQSSIGSNNYLRVGFKAMSKSFNLRVNRLVAIAFVEGRSEKRNVVNHIDGNKRNNHYENLEWCTPSENSKHAVDTGLVPR